MVDGYLNKWLLVKAFYLAAKVKIDTILTKMNEKYWNSASLGIFLGEVAVIFHFR